MMSSCRILSSEEKARQDQRANTVLKKVWGARAKAPRLLERNKQILAAMPAALAQEFSRIEIQIKALCLAGRGSEVPADLQKRFIEILAHPDYSAAVTSIEKLPVKAARFRPA